MSITEFLLARIAEDEAAVSGHDFSYVEWDTGVPKCRHPEHVVGYSASCWKAAVSARVLRQCEAYRRIVKEVDATRKAARLAPAGSARLSIAYGLDVMLRALASIWSDHPDYQEGWSA